MLNFPVLAVSFGHYLFMFLPFNGCELPFNVNKMVCRGIRTCFSLVTNLGMRLLMDRVPRCCGFCFVPFSEVYMLLEFQ